MEKLPELKYYFSDNRADGHPTIEKAIASLREEYGEEA